MKNRGRTQNGTSNWRMDNLFVFMKARLRRAPAWQGEVGRWMGCMTEIVISSGARDLTKGPSSTLSLQRDQCFVGEVLRLRSG
jgi:hypothetical protein